MLSDRCLSALSVCNVRALWPNGWTDQDETWHAGRPRLWPHCVRWGPSSPSPKGAHTPIFGPCLLWPNSWMDEAGTLHGGRPQPGDFMLDVDPVPFPQKGRSPPPAWYGSKPRPRPHCTRRGPSSRERGTAAPSFWPMSIVATVAHLRYC